MSIVEAQHLSCEHRVLTRQRPTYHLYVNHQRSHQLVTKSIIRHTMASSSSQQTVIDAIQAASPELLREILLRIAFTERPCREAVEQEFLVQTMQSSFSRLSWDGYSTPSPSLQAMQRSSPTKRRRYECCARCAKEYDVTKNDGEACLWHPGMSGSPYTGAGADESFHAGNLVVNSNSGFWKYHREERDGAIDSAESRMKFPERFLWSCCGMQGDVKGVECQTGHHAEPGYSDKRVCQYDQCDAMDM